MATQNFLNQYTLYKTQIEKRLGTVTRSQKPQSVYEPIRYVLHAGGKRVRSVLTLLACEAVGGRSAQSLDAAIAIEILHNFTLVHDDVMDRSPLRRGRPTVHTKWDTNVAILAGDEMIGYAYQSLAKTGSKDLRNILTVFNNAFIMVCEGQGYDKEFESRTNVTVAEYLLMIRLKTAAVIAAALELGALAGGGTTKQVKALKSFGENLGIAFQIQDDLLDSAGDEEELGKPVGGDILEGKKTLLLLKALERVNGNDKRVLEKVVQKKNISPATVKSVIRIYRESGILDETRKEVARYTQKAQKALKTLPVNKATGMLYWLSQQLVDRNS